MKKHIKGKYSIFCCLLLLLMGYESYAQPRSHESTAGGFVRFKKKKRYWSIGGALQAMNYVGDLDPSANLFSPALRYTNPNLGVIVSYRYSPRFTFRGTLSWGRIKGDDKISGTTGDAQFRRMRNSNFRNTIVELKADIIYDFVKNLGDYTKRPGGIIPYIFTGIAGFYHNPKGEYNGKRIALQPLQTEGYKYSKFQVAIPFGAGARVRLSRNWDLAFEIGWRKTFTGYLDDVNKDYVDPSSQSPLAAEMSNKSVNWINQPSNPEAYRNASGAELRGFIKDGAPDIAYERIYYNSEHNRLEFNGWGKEGDQRGKHGGKSDWYILTGFHLTYIIGGRIVCPKFRD